MTNSKIQNTPLFKQVDEIMNSLQQDDKPVVDVLVALQQLAQLKEMVIKACEGLESISTEKVIFESGKELDEHTMSARLAQQTLDSIYQLAGDKPK